MEWTTGLVVGPGLFQPNIGADQFDDIDPGFDFFSRTTHLPCEIRFEPVLEKHFSFITF